MLVTQGDSPITTTWVGYSDVGWKAYSLEMGEGEELKTPRHASTVATRDHTWYISNTGNSSFVVAIYIWNTAWLV